MKNTYAAFLSALAYKCGRVVLSRTSFCFVICKLILYFHILFMYHALYIPTFIFILYFPCFPFFSIYHNRKQMLKLKNFKNSHIQNIVSTLIKVVKLDVQNNNIVSALSDAVTIKVEKDNVNLTLFKVVNFNVYVHNVVLTLIRYCPTLQSHITLTTTLRQRWF